MISSVEVNTPYQFILWAEQCFDEADLCFGHGTDNAYDEAAFLILRALDLPFELDDSQLNQSLSRDTRDYLIGLVAHRIQQSQRLCEWRNIQQPDNQAAVLYIRLV